MVDNVSRVVNSKHGRQEVVRWAWTWTGLEKHVDLNDTTLGIPIESHARKQKWS